MKRYLVLFAVLFSFTTTFAQVQWYNTTAFATAKIYNNRYYWSEWEKSDMRISLDLTNDIIKIYSPSPQVYIVRGTANNGEAYTDNSGGRNVKFYVIDQDGDKGEVRLRIETNGNSQLYVDFADCAWVYNVKRIYIN